MTPSHPTNNQEPQYRNRTSGTRYAKVHFDGSDTAKVVSVGGMVRTAMVKNIIKIVPEDKKKVRGTTTNTIWSGMKQRCFNPNSPAYKYYGGRGITVCERWRNSYKNFLEDMGERPEGRSIDRIDNDGNYEPGNCRWATPTEQVRNRRAYEHLSLRNTSGFKWVSFHKREKKWFACIPVIKGNKARNVGLYDTAEDAHRACLAVMEVVNWAEKRIAELEQPNPELETLSPREETS